MSKKNTACILVPDTPYTGAFSEKLKTKLCAAFSPEVLSLKATAELSSPEITALRGAWIDALVAKIKAHTDTQQPCSVIGIGTGALVALNACMHARPSKLVFINTPPPGLFSLKDQLRFLAHLGARSEKAVFFTERRALQADSLEVISEISCPTLVLQTEKAFGQHRATANLLLQRLGTGQWMTEKEFFTVPGGGRDAVSDTTVSAFIKKITEFLS